MASKRKRQLLWILLVFIIPVLLIGRIFFASKRNISGDNAPPPPMGQFQATRYEKWKSQEFFSITNGADLQDAVGGFTYEYDESLSDGESQALKNAVFDFVTAFQKGTFEDYAKFRIPVKSIHFPVGISNAMWKVFKIPVETIRNDPVQAYRQYWYATKRDTLFTNYWIAVCVTNSMVRVEKSSCPTNDLFESLTAASPTLTVDSLKDTPRFAKEVQEASDPIVIYLKSKLSPATLDLLLTYRSGPALNAREAVVKDFNVLIQDGSLYDNVVFRKVQLSPWTENLLKTNPKGANLVRLNRLILSDALSAGILRADAWAENIGIGWKDPSVSLEPSREQVFQAVGYVKIATLRILPKPRDNDPVFPVYVRWYWSPGEQKWLPDMLISMYTRPRRLDLFF